MTGRRVHRTTEVITCRPWKSKSPFASRHVKISIRKGTRGVRTRCDTLLPSIRFHCAVPRSASHTCPQLSRTESSSSWGGEVDSWDSQQVEGPLKWGHLKPVTFKPVFRILRIFGVFVSVLSAFSVCCSMESPQIVVLWGERGLAYAQNGVDLSFFPCFAC